MIPARIASAWALATALLPCAPAGAAPTEVQVWRHQTGATEMQASALAVERFNRSQPRWHVVVEAIPQGSYKQAVIAAAMTKKLPCALTLDQPSVPNFAWAGHIQPLEGALRPAGADGLIPGARSIYQGRLWAVGQFDVALTLFARASVLQRLGVRVATMAEPYSADEFRNILRRLKAEGVRYPLDLNAQLGGEWVAYAFSPWLQSAGADLIDRGHFTRVDGVLNSDASIGVVDYYRSLFEERLTPRKPIDDLAFPSGQAIFHYTGSWSAADYRARFGDDLLALPVPDFGHGPKIGAGSWQWAISSSCATPSAAREFIEFLLKPEEIADFSDRSGLMPTSAAAAAMTRDYRPGAFGRAFFEYALAYAVRRPETPGYPMISSSFERALKEAREGEDSAEALDRAVEAIAGDLQRNHRYGF